MFISVWIFVGLFKMFRILTPSKPVSSLARILPTLSTRESTKIIILFRIVSRKLPIRIFFRLILPLLSLIKCTEFLRRMSLISNMSSRVSPSAVMGAFRPIYKLVLNKIPTSLLVRIST